MPVRMRTCVAAIIFVGTVVLGPMPLRAADDSDTAAPQQQMSPKEVRIRKLLDVSGSGKIGMQVLTQMIAQFRTTFPDVPQEFWDNFQGQVKIEEMVDLIVPVYEKHFSDEDVEEMIKFYESPIGKKLVHEMPQLVQESMAAGQAWGRKVAERVMQQLHEKGYVKS